MTKSLQLLMAMIDEDKITVQEVLESCGYKVDVIYKDNVNDIGYSEKVIATKQFD